MEAVSITLDATEEELPIFAGKKTVAELPNTFCIGGVPEATERGKPGVVMAFEVDRDTVAVVQTTLALFLSAADALRARYGDPREEEDPPTPNGDPRDN